MGLLLFIEPDAAALAELARAWAWLVPADLRPIRFTRVGDVFYVDPSGAVHWLDTNCGGFDLVASDVATFDAALATDVGAEWLLTPLVEALEAAGKHAPAGYCYSPVILPIFKEGKMTVQTMNPVPAREHYGMTGDLHLRIRDMPAGEKVKLVVVP